MKTYKFKLSPSKTQEEELYRHLNICRFTYNKLIEILKVAQENSVRFSKYELSNILTLMKEEEDFSFIKNTYSKMIQPLVDRIFSNIKGLAISKKNGNKIGSLRFKNRSNFSSFSYNQSGFKVIFTGKRYNLLHLSKIGDIRLRQHRSIEGTIKQVQIKKNPSGWYAYIITDGEYECKNEKDGEIAFDLGIQDFLVDNQNHHIRNPLFLNQKLSLLKLLQQKLSKSKKGSNNRKKLIHKILRVFEKISNQKNDFFHKLTTEIVKNNSLICLEDLNIQNMIDNKDKIKNKRNTLASSWGMFVNMLKMKVSSTTSKIVFVEPKNTTKECSKCGELKEMPLSMRKYVCSKCGLELNRDYNSALNILKKGKELAFVESGVTHLMKQEATSFMV